MQDSLYLNVNELITLPSQVIPSFKGSIVCAWNSTDEYFFLKQILAHTSVVCFGFLQKQQNDKNRQTPILFKKNSIYLLILMYTV